MQHGKRGHQEPTALIPNCNIPVFKTYFSPQKQENKTLPRAQTHNGTNPNPQARHKFYKWRQSSILNKNIFHKRNKFHSLKNIIKINQFPKEK